jgi:hypothetical protein
MFVWTAEPKENMEVTSMGLNWKKKVVIGSAFCLLGLAGFGVQGSASATVGVDVSTPNVRVQVGTPAPPPVVVVEHNHVIKEKSHHDNGKHKGHYKKHTKHKKQKKH